MTHCRRVIVLESVVVRWSYAYVHGGVYLCNAILVMAKFCYRYLAVDISAKNLFSMKFGTFFRISLGIERSCQ